MRTSRHSVVFLGIGIVTSLGLTALSAVASGTPAARASVSSAPATARVCG